MMARVIIRIVVKIFVKIERMREQFLSLFNFDSEYFYFKVLVVAIIICKLLSNR
jgi:hypothetical protein